MHATEATPAHMSVVHGAMKKPMTGQSQLLNAASQRTGWAIHQMMIAKRGPNRNNDENKQHIGTPFRLWWAGPAITPVPPIVPRKGLA